MVDSKLKLGALISLAVLAVYLVYPQESSLVSEYNLNYQEFLDYELRFSKSYSDQERSLRFQIFHNNLNAIRKFNNMATSFVLGPNKFADLTPEEFKKMFSMDIPKNKKMDIADIKPLTAPPAVQDWRAEGAVTDVINQSLCKASWAIAVVGAVEGAMVAQGLINVVNLSPQEIIDCDNGSGDHGCAGGLVDDAYTFMVNNGSTTDLIYPYTAKNQTCNQAAVNQKVVSIKGFKDITPLSSSALINAVATTPVVSAVEVSNYVWQFYQSGVITNFCGGDVEHYVLVVGYDTNNNFFTVKNSWGAQWGESGYARIGIASGSGVCGIQSLSSYPIFS